MQLLAAAAPGPEPEPADCKSATAGEEARGPVYNGLHLSYSSINPALPKILLMYDLNLSECIGPVEPAHPYRTHIRVSGTAVSRTGGSQARVGCAEHRVRSILTP